jgi:hypothetical protein
MARSVTIPENLLEHVAGCLCTPVGDVSLAQAMRRLWPEIERRRAQGATWPSY